EGGVSVESGHPIPLGLDRPVTPDPSLRVLSDSEFEAQRKVSVQEANRADGLVDEVADLEDLTNGQRLDIAKAQDRYSAYELEKFRRDSADSTSDDVFHKLLNLTDRIDTKSDPRGGEAFEQAKVLLEILEGRKGTEPLVD